LFLLPVVSERLRDEWNRLVEETDAPFFYRYRVLEAYRRSGMQQQLGQAYVIVRERPCRTVVAILPAYLLEMLDPYGDLKACPDMSCMRPQRSVVSHFWHCYDSTVVTQKSCFDLFQVISEVLRGLAMSWRAELFGFINLDEEDQNSRYLQDSGLKRYVMPPRYRISLEEYSSVKDYLFSLRNHVRYELMRQWRRALEAGAEIAILSARDVNLSEVIAIIRNTAARYQSEHYYPEFALQEFLKNVGEQAKIVTVRVQGCLASAWVFFTDGDSLHTWAAGAEIKMHAASTFN
jgi:predicted N-acyltransferase